MSEIKSTSDNPEQISKPRPESDGKIREVTDYDKRKLEEPSYHVNENKLPEKERGPNSSDIKKDEHSKLKPMDANENVEDNNSKIDSVDSKVEDNQHPKLNENEGKADIGRSEKADGSTVEKDSANDSSELERRMEPPTTIKFNCPDWADRAEFQRQLKRQEDGINKQSVAENMDNREQYKSNGRAPESNSVQHEYREKEIAKRYDENIKAGMNPEDARASAISSVGDEVALHEPDQRAGGKPDEITSMGDAKINSSIGSQWAHGRAKELDDATETYAKEHPNEDLSKTKMNVKLEFE